MPTNELEPNDIPTSATALVLGSAMQGQLSTGSDIDTFGFTTTGAGSITLAFDAPTADSNFKYFTLGLYDANGLLLSQFQTGQDMILPMGAVAGAGTYYIKVSDGPYFHDGGTYSLTASFTAGPVDGHELEPNDTPANATALTLDGAMQGQLSSTSDVDNFSFTTAAAGLVSLTFDSPTVTGYGDEFSLGLYDAGGILLSRFQTWQDATFQLGALAGAGTWTIRVANPVGSNYYDSGAYSLTPHFAAGSTDGHELESNDTPANATPLVLGSAMQGQLSTPADVDTFSFTTVAAGIATLTFDGPTASSFYKYFTLGLYDANGTLLSQFQSGQDGTFQLGALGHAGTWYLTVASPGVSFDSGGYSLTASFGAGPVGGYELEPNDTPANATALTLGNAMQGQLSSAADLDIFSFTTTAAGSVSIAFDAPTADSYFKYFTLGLYDANGLLLSQYQTGQDASYEMGSVAAAGTYFVRVAEGWASFYDAGIYSLTTGFTAGSAGAHEIESNDTLESATVLLLDGRMQAQLSTFSDVDCFRFVTAAPGTLSLWFDEPSAFSYSDAFTLGLYDAGGALLWQAHTVQDATYQLGSLASAGTWYLKVSGGTYYHSDTYDLTALFVASGNHAPTGTVGFTGNAFVGQTLQAISGLADSDGAGPISYDWQTSLDGTAWDFATTGPALVLSGAMEGRQVRVVAHYVDALGTTERVASSAAVIADPDDFSATTATTGTVAVGVNAAGHIESSGDHDWFRVNLTGGVRYVIDLAGVGAGVGTLTDPYLALRASDGTVLDSIDNGGAGLDSRLSFTPGISGTYFIEAGHASTGTGTYTVAVTLALDDYTANSATAGDLAIGGFATGTIEVADDEDFFRVQLNAGTPYLFDLKGTASGGGSLADPLLMLHNADNTALRSDDDGASAYGIYSTDAQIVFIPQESGTYFVNAGTATSATGTYRLTASTLNADYYIQAVLDQPHRQWNTTNVTYSFATSVPPEYAPGTVVNFQPFSEAQKAAARQALTDISHYVNLSFTEVGDLDGQIRFGTSNLGPDIGAGTVSWPATGTYFDHADIAFNNAVSYLDNSPAVGSAGYAALVHEIGHALGLKHPGDYNVGGGGSPPPYLPTSQDTLAFTNETYNIGVVGNATTPMVFDIAALQYLYGARPSWNAGDNSYTFSISAIYSIWDTAGTDTLDASAWTTSVTLDLNPGSASYAGYVGFDTVLDPIVSIAINTAIENANGGSGTDKLLGNTAANMLAGGADADRLDAGAGNDTLDGGLGADYMLGGSGSDAYVVDSAGDVVIESSSEASWDYVDAYVAHTLEANVEALIMHNGANGTGNADGNALYGNYDGAANVLSGGAGSDTYNVGAGDVVVENPGEGSWDFINAYASRTLEANVEAMIMLNGANGTGNAQDNALYGNYDAAANILTGLDGNDIYSVGAGDVVVEASGAAAGSWDFINAYVSRTLELNVEAMIMLNGSDGTGNAQDNALYGNYDAAANTLTGMGGNDVYLLGAGDSVVEAPDGGSWDFMVSYATHTLEANVEAMILDNGAHGTGNSADNALYGNYDAAANTLTGGDGNDVYNVGAGDVVVEAVGVAGGTWDYIHAFVSRTLEANVEAMIMYNGATGTGNSAANTLYGNWDLSANLLVGGDGDDTYVVLAGDTVQESANQGTDTVVAFASFTLSANVENLSLSGTDAINGTGNAQGNLILGNGADNEISGKDGNDRLYGGNGIDRFVFDAAPNAATNVDVITDFTPGTDKLVLDHLIFTQLAVGNLQPGNLVAANGAFASQGDDHVLYDSTGGNLFYDSDGSGAAAPVWLAHLDGNPALAAGDFAII